MGDERGAEGGRNGSNVPVDVLGGANCFSYRAFAVGTDVFTKGKLNQDTADIVVGVEVLDELNELGCSRFSWDLDMAEGDPDLLGGLGLHTDIGR